MTPSTARRRSTEASYKSSRPGGEENPVARAEPRWMTTLDAPSAVAINEAGRTP